MNTFNLTLDLNKSRASSPVRLRQGDKSGTTISALILDHGATANLTGMTAQLVMELPDGTQYYRKSASVSGNVVTVVVDESTAASVSGRTANAYFQLLQGTTVKASTGSFVVEILPDALEGHTVPESYDSAIQDAIDALDAAVEQMPDMVEDVLEAHPEWTTTVQDGSITKAKLATDLARDRERLLYRLANMLTNALPEGDVATATDAAKTPVAGLALYGRSTQAGTPTPSAPVAIQSVAGNVVSEVKTGLFVNSGTGKIGISDGAQTAVARVSRNTDYTLTYEGGNRCIVGGVDSPNIASGDTARILFSSSSRVSPKTFNSGENDYVAIFVATSAAPATDIALYAGTAAYPYVPYDHAGLWARGRNLLDQNDLPATNTTSGITFTNNGDGSFGTSGTATAARSINLYSAEKYASVFKSGGKFSLAVFGVSVSGATFNLSLPYTTPGSSTERYLSPNNSPQEIPAGSTAKSVRLYVPSGTTVQQTSAVRAMLVREDSIPTAYQPYESTVTPVPLDGHELRSLPDGTRDEVTVGADGHAVLVQRVQLTTQAVTDGVTGTVGVDVMSSTGAIANGATVLYKLATPVTHDLGYVAAVPLCGPDLTAQAVPTAPMQLTYERDLNTTLARLESAIATLA